MIKINIPVNFNERFEIKNVKGTYYFDKNLNLYKCGCKGENGMCSLEFTTSVITGVRPIIKRIVIVESEEIRK